MAEAQNPELGKNELILNLRKKGPKFKAGAELSSSVNMVDISYNIEETEQEHTLELNVTIKNV